VLVAYLPGNEDLPGEARWVINRLFEEGVKTPQPDFLKYHRDTPSPYRGVCSEIVKTQEFASAEECAADSLWLLASQNPSRQRRAI